jgi:hypothetical protein
MYLAHAEAEWRWSRTLRPFQARVRFFRYEIYSSCCSSQEGRAGPSPIPQVSGNEGVHVNTSAEPQDGIPCLRAHTIPSQGGVASATAPPGKNTRTSSVVGRNGADGAPAGDPEHRQARKTVKGELERAPWTSASRSTWRPPSAAPEKAKVDSRRDAGRFAS